MPTLIKKIVIYFLLLTTATGIAALFWQQEMKYALPTPLPIHYQPVALRQLIQVAGLFPKNSAKPMFLHFFNPDCPCSRFNLKQFQQLVKQYGDKVHFVAVFQTSKHGSNVQKMRERYELTIPAIGDSDGQLAEACGVYSTPQAVIIDKEHRLYYRGNYNQSRYCMLKKTAFAQMALDSLLRQASAPSFGQLATQAYGCELPQNTIPPLFDF